MQPSFFLPPPQVQPLYTPQFFNIPPMQPNPMPPPQPMQAAPIPQPMQATPAVQESNICHFYERGMCRFGNSCKRLHQGTPDDKCRPARE